MQHPNGAPLSESDINIIGAYLSVVCGSAKADGPKIISAYQLPVSASASGEALDVQVLLTNNGCTDCHDINKTIIGPAFKAIAKKCQSDTGAISKLVVSIRNGGSGKWGNMSMPPMNVNDKQAQALAEFILKQ